MHRNQWELTKVSILANFVNCEYIIKAVFIAFMPNNAHIDIVFHGNGATSFVGIEALVIFFKIQSVDKRPRMTLRHALPVISKYMQGISTMV